MALAVVVVVVVVVPPVVAVVPVVPVVAPTVALDAGTGASGLVVALAVPGLVPALPTAVLGAPGSTVAVGVPEVVEVSALLPLLPPPLQPAKDRAASNRAVSNHWPFLHVRFMVCPPFVWFLGVRKSVATENRNLSPISMGKCLCQKHYIYRAKNKNSE
jgi:hypothetical protein